jgi:anti-anti-sigma factor
MEKMDVTQLSLAVKSVEGAAVVEANGELNLWTAEAFESVLKDAVERESNMVILDLTRVTILDVGILKTLRQASVVLGPDKKLCAVACGEPRTVLEMTRFDDIINIYSSIEDVLAAGSSNF